MLAGTYDRRFYGGMSIAMGLTVFGGFARTYYGPLTIGGPRATLSGGPWSTLVHAHAALFTTWVVLFIVQTALVASRRVAIPLFDLTLFSGFLIAALLMRRHKEAHKRLMLLAYVNIITAAIARLPGVMNLGPPVFFGLAFCFVIAGAVYDYLSRGRVHKVYWVGGLITLLSVPLRLAISATPMWRSLAAWLVG